MWSDNRINLDLNGFVLKDGGTFPLFNEEWSAEEDGLLLDAIEQHGFGNWYKNCFDPLLLCLATYMF